jgi:hypothetical protein
LLPKLVVADSRPFNDAPIRCVKDGAESSRMSQEHPFQLVVITDAD